MAKIAVVVLVAAALGGLASLGLIDALAKEHVLTVGNVTVPISVEERIYDVAQLRIAVFSSGLIAGLVAAGLSFAFNSRKRRR